MLRLTRQHILRHYKGKMNELTVTVVGHRRGWSIFMKTPAKNDGLLPIAHYSKYSHLVILSRSDRPIYLSLLGSAGGWMCAKDSGFTLANMRSLIARGFVEFKDPLPKVKRWEGNWRDWEIDVQSKPFKLSEYGNLVIQAWSWYGWMWTPDSPDGMKVVYPHKPV